MKPASANLLLLLTGFVINLFQAAQTQAQSVDVIKANQLYTMLERCDDDYEVCVYNFWATWCAPCIRELPHFEALNASDQRIKVNLISIDAVEHLEKRVKPFIAKRSIESKVFLLDETDFNKIIPKVSNQWSGAIPATVIINSNGQKYFFEKEFKEGELEQVIHQIISLNN